MTLAVALAAFMSQGPVALDALGVRIAAAIDARLGANYDAVVGRTTIELRSNGFEVAVEDLRIVDLAGAAVVVAPRAAVSLDLLSLLVGKVAPSRIEVFDFDLHIALTEEGAVAVTAGAQPLVLGGASPAGSEVSSARSAPGEHAALRPLGDAVRRILALSLGGESPLGVLRHVGVARGRLVFDDRTAGRVLTFESFDARLERGDDAAALALSAVGANGRWSVTARAAGADGEGGVRGLEIEARDLSADEIMFLAGARKAGFDFDTPVSARLRVGLSESGGFETAVGQVAVGAGFLYVHHQHQEPLRIDEASAGFSWDAARGAFEVGPVSYSSGRTRLTASGVVAPPAAAGAPWTLQFLGGTGVLGAERPGERDVLIERATLNARLDPATSRLTVDRLDLRGPNLSVGGSGSMGWALGERAFGLRLTLSDSDADAVLRVWPGVAAPGARAWFLAHLEQGRFETGGLTVDLTERSFVTIAEGRGVDDGAVQIHFRLMDGALNFAPGVPSLLGLKGEGRVSGRSAVFEASAGYMAAAGDHRLTLVEGRFDAADFAQPPVHGTITARVAGSVDAVGDVLSREGLKPFGGFALEPGMFKGAVDGRLTVDLDFGVSEKPVVRVAAQVANLVVERIVGKERLEQGVLAITADPTGLRASGQGRLFGANAKIELKKPLGGLAEAVVSVPLDDAARARMGWSMAGLTGTVGARLVTVLGGPDKPRPTVDLDLGRAAIGQIAPGVSKAAGRPGRASFVVVSEGGQTSLQSFVLEVGPLYAQGVVELEPGGAFSGASFSQARISPGDDMKLELSAQRDALRVVARATTLDVRPFMQDLVSGAPQGGAERTGQAATLPAIDLDVRATLATGANGQAMSNLDLKVALRPDGLRDFRLAARSGRAAVTGGLFATPAGSPPQFYIRTEDGGSLLSFFDLYRRMDGGDLQLAGTFAPGRTIGTLSVRGFTLRNETALQRLVAEGVRAPEAGRFPIDPNAIAFDRLEAAFARTGGRLDLREGVVSGPSVGATIEGMIDFSRNQVALNGTFVPVYGLNNLFSKIPLFGPLLGGGANEGLIGINYRIAGPASAPLLTVNPLSAMTPGFLRKLFGAVDGHTPPPLPPAVSGGQGTSAAPR